MQRSPATGRTASDTTGARRARRVARARRAILIAGLFQMVFAVVVYGWIYPVVFGGRFRVIVAVVSTALIVTLNGLLLARNVRRADTYVAARSGPLTLTHL